MSDNDEIIEAFDWISDFLNDSTSFNTRKIVKCTDLILEEISQYRGKKNKFMSELFSVLKKNNKISQKKTPDKNEINPIKSKVLSKYCLFLSLR